MKPILAINTADNACSVTLKQQNQTITKTEPCLNKQSELLLPFIDTILKEATITLSDLEAIAYSAGPASFTGIRLALSTAQGLAMPHNLPIIPVCSLQALAWAFYSTVITKEYDDRNNPDSPEGADILIPGLPRLLTQPRNDDELKILVCTNAYMGQLFWGAFTINEQKISIEQTACLVSPEELPTLKDEQWIGIGNAWSVYQPQLAPLLKKQVVASYPDFLPHSAQAVADLAEKILQQKTNSHTAPDPIYLRTENAWKKKRL